MDVVITTPEKITIAVCNHALYYVLDGNIEENTVLYRTKGLADICGLELEINLPLDPSEAKRMIHLVVDKVHIGEVLSDQLISTKYTQAPILVQERPAKYPEHDNEMCYRLIFADENQKLPTDDDCNPIYSKQME